MPGGERASETVVTTGRLDCAVKLECNAAQPTILSRWLSAKHDGLLTKRYDFSEPVTGGTYKMSEPSDGFMECIECSPETLDV